MSFAATTFDLRPGEETPWGTFVPTLYRPHADLTTTVTQNGRPLGFTVAQVAVDRRWAIGPDGEVIDQTEFADHLRLVWDEQYRLRNANPQSHEGNPIPRVERYVAYTQDEVRPDRLRPLAGTPSLVAVHAERDTGPLVDVSALRAQGFVPAPQTPPTSEAAPTKRARKPMSEEAKKAAGDRFRAMHAARRAAKEAAPAAEE